MATRTTQNTKPAPVTPNTQSSVASKLQNMTEKAPDKQSNLIEYETSNGLVKLAPETVRMYLVNGNGSVTGQEIQMFIALCKYQKLNPFLREAYLIKYGNQPATMVVGKDTFTRRAAQIEDCDGYEAGVVVMGEDNMLEYREGALVLPEETLVGGWSNVYRRSRQRPTKITIGFDEYVGRKGDGSINSMWTVKPGSMIRKVALVQALREAFPTDFMGMYVPEERQVDPTVLPETMIDPAKEPVPERKMESKVELKQEPKPEKKPEVKPDIKPEQKPEPNACKAEGGKNESVIDAEIDDSPFNEEELNSLLND